MGKLIKFKTTSKGKTTYQSINIDNIQDTLYVKEDKLLIIRTKDIVSFKVPDMVPPSSPKCKPTMKMVEKKDYYAYSIDEFESILTILKQLDYSDDQIAEMTSEIEAPITIEEEFTKTSKDE